MFGNNAFGALAMDQQAQASSSSSGGPSLVQVEGDEVEAEWLSLTKTNGEVYVKVQDPVDLNDLPSECNLMAVSNNWGLVIVGGQQDVRIHRLKEIQSLIENSPKDALPTSSPIATISLSARPVWIRLAMNEERLVVATIGGSGVHVYKLKDVISGNTNPYHSFTSNIPSYLLDVLPNPAPSSPLTTLIAPEGFVIADIESRTLSSPLSGPFTCACWSAKGKQIVVGTPSGKLAQYTPEGTLKAEIPPPPELDGPHQPTSIQWLENDLFLVYYARQDAEPEDPLESFVITRTKESITYTKFFDIMDSFGVAGRSSRYRHFTGLKSWGEKTRHLAFFVSGLATEIVVLHGANEGGSSKWELVTLGETARAILPAAKKGMSDEDTSVLALELDLTAEKPIERGMVGGEDLPNLPPPPRLIAYSQSGFLISFNVVNAEAGSYPGKIVSNEISPTSSSDIMDTGSNVVTPTVQEPPKPSFGFGQSSSTAFGSTTPSSTPSKPAFGSSGFGQSSTSAFGSSGFGQTAFGSTTPSTTPAKPAFGQSGFGSTTPTSTPTQQPAFGSSAFGQSSKPASGFSGFGQTSSPSAFGQTNSASSTPAFGSSAFGQSSKPATGSAFGQSAFGQSSKPVSTGSAFGQSAFGQTAKTDVSSSSGQSAFGQTSKPDTPAFGFGAASKPSSTGFGFGSAGFGQKSEPEKKATPESSSNLFSSASFGSGSSSAFGQSAFGAKSSASPSTETKPPFAGFGQSTKPSPFAVPEPAKKETSNVKTDDFGFGGFASALGETTKPASVPGLADSPPSSPVLQGGKAGRAPGLDESPPNSPPAPSKPLQSSTSGPTAFIKPATGFSGASAGAFGNFAPKTQTSAFGSSTPAAFASPPPSKPGGGSAFGQTSKPASPAFGSSAFGQPSTPSAASAFGQSSKPVGFGQTSAPSATFGNISGGFGGFAKKPETGSASDKPASGGFAGFGQQTSGSAGFGGFASQTGGSSIFGEKKDGAGSPFAAPAKSTTTVFGAKSKEVSKEEDKVETPSLPGYDVPEPAKKIDEAKPTSGSTDEVTEKPVEEVAEAAETKTTPDESKAAEDVDTAAAVPLPQADTPLEEKIPKTNESVPSENSGDEPVLVEHDDIPPVTSEGVVNEVDGHEEGNDYDDENDHEDEDEDEGVEDEYEEEDEGYEDEDEGEYEDEEEGDYDGEYDDEEDYEEGDEDDPHGATSLAPDMSPIAEEGSDFSGSGPEDDQEKGNEGRTVKPPLKSPPAWFAKTAEPSLPVPSNFEGTEAGSLLSRLGPAPDNPVIAAPQPIAAAQKLPPSFNLKHTVRTSSPLGQPPQMASTSPEASPGKPSAFNFFGKKEETSNETSKTPAFGTAKPGTPFGLGLGKPPVQGAASTAQAGPPSLFGGFGQAATTTKEAEKDDKPPSLFAGFGQTATTPKTANKDDKPPSLFAGFGQTASSANAPTPSSGLFANVDQKKDVQTTPQAGSLFAGFGQKKDEQAAPQAGSLFAGFGQTKTETSTSAQPGSLFGTSQSKTQEQKPPANISFAGFGQVSQVESKPSSATPFAGFNAKPEPPAPAPSKPVAKTRFEVPARVAVAHPQPPKDDGAKTMSAVLDRMLNSLLSDLQHLKETISANGKYHALCVDRSLPPVTLDTLHEHKDLPFSSLSQITTMVRTLESRLADLKSVESGIEAKISDVQSSLMKTDMKVGQADKFIEARTNGSFSRALLQVKELSPEQAEHQTRLRKLTQTVESTLVELEDGIAQLKKGLQNKEPSEQAVNESSPSLGKIHRGVRKVDLGIKERAATIEDLANRIASLRVATPVRRRGQPHLIPEKGVSKGIIPLSLEPSSSVIEAVERSLDRQSAIRSRFGGKSGSTARVNRLDVGALKVSPKKIDSVPVPGFHGLKSKESVVKSSIPSVVSPAGTTAPTGFGSFFTPPKTAKSTPTQSGPFSFGSFGNKK